MPACYIYKGHQVYWMPRRMAVPSLLAPAASETTTGNQPSHQSPHAARDDDDMLSSHVEMPACRGAAGIKLFGKVITTTTAQPQPHRAGAAPPKLVQQQQQASAGRGSADLMEEVARARAAAAEARLPCPRCSSRDTKFCYFNNYNVNQPRHFCRACHRYWTAGGAIRNVPVGSGRRKNRPVLVPPPPAPPHAVTANDDHSSSGGAGSSPAAPPVMFSSVFTAPPYLGPSSHFTSSPPYYTTAAAAGLHPGTTTTTEQCLWLVATAERSVTSDRAF
ncbi:hypothetical protein U9M48_044557 [Paspalum notatum var. saurae]|uniref:Dof-type domain-containing protein n=1 Tax=Paspalum notatum var. saurae TaxID=547442 RepID=A0AAQ3UVJ7_PASNO